MPGTHCWHGSLAGPLETDDETRRNLSEDTSDGPR
jgi:hypothetical protein